MEKKMEYKDSIRRGQNAESRFTDMIGDSFIRKATRDEDIHEHWDILCKEGKVDVKGLKKTNRRDSKTNPDIHFYEFKNVGGKLGWGVPTETPRMIAFESEEGFILVDPSDIYKPLIDKCEAHGEGWNFFQCRGREGRNDWFTKVPTEFLREYSCGIVEPVSGIRIYNRAN